MNQKLVKMAEALGIDTKGKSDLELMKAVSENWGREQTAIEEASKQEVIETGNKRYAELKKFFDKPFEIWVETVGQKKSPECVPVVGYNPKTSSVIVSKEVVLEGKTTHKLYSVDEKLIINSVSKLDGMKVRKPPVKKTKADKKQKPDI
jgi:hypothetical protein